LQSADIPLTLSRLNKAIDDTQRDEAWAEFVAAHSDVVLHTCRSVLRDHDAAMDAYAFVLEALREDGHRRLRAYVPDGKTKFATWLLVVTRRLVLDHIRHRYGRSRSSDETRRADQVARRRLEDLLADEIEPDQLPGASRDSPDAAIRREQLIGALRRSVAELRPEDRLLLVLRFVDERSVKDMARTLRLPSVFHVYRRVSSVLTTLRERLRRSGVDEAEP
jgi:RNA polymerase sigma factor (sigma-70 family)